MSASPSLLRAPAAGFPAGTTRITRADDPLPGAAIPLGLEFDLVHLIPGETRTETDPRETCWVLLGGSATVTAPGMKRTVCRESLFDEPPTALHVCAATPVSVAAGATGAEWAVVRTANATPFAPRLFLPADLKPEYRGAGLVQNACLRNVRLIFDRTTRPEPNLVVGEVVNYPGRWSSYPPHHHDQPEIYHYRFTAPAGYGHAELGEEVVKVRHGDTAVIPPGRDHAQVAAPGYGMYYLWLIRHLPGNPYTGFTFAPEHAWTLDASRQGWRPRDLPQGLT
jgi:5-deoxy-glucuronate isomerase